MLTLETMWKIVVYPVAKNHVEVRRDLCAPDWNRKEASFTVILTAADSVARGTQKASMTTLPPPPRPQKVIAWTGSHQRELLESEIRS